MALPSLLPLPATLDTDLADDVVPQDEDAPVSLSMAVCMSVVLLVDPDLHKIISIFLHKKLCTTARGGRGAARVRWQVTAADASLPWQEVRRRCPARAPTSGTSGC